MKKVITIGILLITTINLCAQTYNPSKAAEYASFWCDKRNTLSSPYYNQTLWGGPYIDYGLPINGGADCAAFVSQCLIAGGLSLAAGTNGHGAYVKPDKVIAGAAELVIHLDSFQYTTKEIRDVYDYYAGSDIGDPMFLLNSMSTETAYHSYMCSMLDIQDGISEPLFSAHTRDVCNTIARTEYKVYFHIKSTYPDHCFDCKKNGDEDEIDCGGSCPPCEHAPQYKNFDSPTNNLPSKSYALEKITAGNAAVHVLSGQNVGFYTLGEIVLLPGFEAQEGSDFNAQIKGNILGVTADCDKFCAPIVYNVYTRWDDGYDNHTFIAEVANVNKIYCEFYYMPNGGGINSIDPRYLVYTTTVTDQEGKVRLWNLIDGEFSYNLNPDCSIRKYYYYLSLEKCQGGSYFEIMPFYIYNYYEGCKSSSTGSEPEEISLPAQFPSPNPENTISPNGNTTLSFTIIPNPNPGSFSIKFSDAVTELQKIIITDVRGVIVYNNNNLPIVTDNIQLLNPAAGMYIIKLFFKDKILTSKFAVL